LERFSNKKMKLNCFNGFENSFKPWYLACQKTVIKHFPLLSILSPVP